MMSQRVCLPCPRCGRPLQVRVENLGRRGICKHCNHKFQAGVDGADVLAKRAAGSNPNPTPSSSSRSRSRSKSRRADKLELRMRVLEAELRAVLSHLADQSAQHASVLQELETTRGRLAQAPGAPESDDAREPRDHRADDPGAAVAVEVPERPEDTGSVPGPESIPGWETDAEADLAGLRGRASEASRLEDELRAERARSELLRAQILEIESRGGVLALPDADRLEAAMAPGPEMDSGPLGAAAAECRPEAGPAVIAQEVERLRSRLGEIEPAMEAALARMERERAEWDTERRVLQERYQAALAGAEARARLDAPDEESAEGVDEADRRRLTAECDALKRVVRRLRKRVVAREQVRAELEQALGQARERSEAERREWQTWAERTHAELEAATSELAESKRHALAVARERDALATRLELAETLNDEGDGEVESLNAEILSLRGQLEQAAQEHARALDALRDEHAAEQRDWTECAERLLREAENAHAERDQHAEAAARHRDEHAAEREAAQSQQAHDRRQLESLRAELDALRHERDRAAEDHERARRSLCADLEAQRARSLDSLRDELEQERAQWMERTRSEHARTLDALRDELAQSHARQLDDLRTRFEDERLRLGSSSDQEHVQALADHRAALEQAHAEALDALRAALSSEHAQALETLRTELEHERSLEHANLEQDHARTLDSLRAEHEHLRLQWAERLAHLEREIAEARDERDDNTQAAAQHRDELAEALEEALLQHADDGRRIESLQTDLDALRQERDATEQEHEETLNALRAELDQQNARETESLGAELEDSRQQTTEQLEQLQAALDEAQRDRDEALRECERLAERLNDPDANRVVDDDSEAAQNTIRRLGTVLAELSNKQILTNQRKAELIAQVMTLRATLARLTQSGNGNGLGLGNGEIVVRPRPQSEAFADFGEYRADLARWLTEAQQRRQMAGAQIDRLDLDLGSARQELELINRDFALGSWDLDDEDEEAAEIAFPFEAE